MNMYDFSFQPMNPATLCWLRLSCNVISSSSAIPFFHGYELLESDILFRFSKLIRQKALPYFVSGR